MIYAALALAGIGLYLLAEHGGSVVQSTEWEINWSEASIALSADDQGALRLFVLRLQALLATECKVAAYGDCPVQGSLLSQKDPALSQRYLIALMTTAHNAPRKDQWNALTLADSLHSGGYLAEAGNALQIVIEEGKPS